MTHTTDLSDVDLTETGEEYARLAEKIDALADAVRTADSIANDAPALCDLFNEVRTSNRSSRDGRYVALFDVDGDEWSCRSVEFLESGTHYRDTGADLSLSFKPFPFLGTDEFAEHIASDLRRQAQSARQSAYNFVDRDVPTDATM